MRYTAQRKAQGPANATINRELAWLKQMFRLAMKSGRLLAMPPIDVLPEHNARQGFLEDDQFASVVNQLPKNSGHRSASRSSPAGA